MGRGDGGHTFLLPQFVEDLKGNADAHFARRVLGKTILRDGTFRVDADDHPYHGVDGAWIRYVGQGKNAFRVIFIRDGSNVYLFRAGRHDIEERVVAPRRGVFGDAVPVVESKGLVEEAVVAVRGRGAADDGTVDLATRFLRNARYRSIGREILGRRNLPHRDIWLVAPFITPKLLLPTARLGKMLLEQVEDGARVLVVTAVPANGDIGWLERLEERDIGVCCYPRLHSKLYCFVLDENRKYEAGLPDASTLSSLVIVGSANVTGAGLGFGDGGWNEELCYRVPASELRDVESYVTELVGRGYGLRDLRARRTSGRWRGVEDERW